MIRPKNKRFNSIETKINLGEGSAKIDQQADFYDQFWDIWHEKYRKILNYFYHFDEKSRVEFIKDSIKKYASNKKNRKAFDLGCGRGRISFLLNKKGWKTTGLDLSKKTILNIKKKNKKINFHYGDMFTFNKYKRAEYDLVVSSEVMEHININQRIKYVELIKNLLKKN